MRWLIVLGLSLMLYAGGHALADHPHQYPATVERVVDGDTMDMLLDMGLGVKMTVRVRIQGLDTPETYRPKTEAERKHGEEATAKAHELLQITPLQLESYGWVIFNRVEGRIRLADGRDFSEAMREAGFQKRAEYIDEPSEEETVSDDNGE